MMTKANTPSEMSKKQNSNTKINRNMDQYGYLYLNRDISI